MARIKITDLPKDMKISKEEMKKVLGGALITGTILDFCRFQSSRGPAQIVQHGFSELGC